MNKLNKKPSFTSRKPVQAETVITAKLEAELEALRRELGLPPERFGMIVVDAVKCFAQPLQRAAGPPH